VILRWPVLNVIFCRAGGAAAVILVTIAVSRTLGPKGLGVFTLFQSWGTFLATLIGFGFPIYVLRSVVSLDTGGNAVAADKLVRRALFWVTAIGSVAILGLYLFRSPIVARFAPLGTPGYVAWLAGVAGLVTVLLRVLSEGLKARFRPNAAVLLQFAAAPAVGAALLGIALVVLGTLRLSWVMGSYIAATAVTCSIAALLWARSNGQPSVGAPAPHRLHAGRLSLLWTVSCTAVAFDVVAYTLVGRFSGASALGQFSAALRVSTMAGIGLAAVAAIYAPRFARAYVVGDKAVLTSCVRSAAWKSLMTYAPAFLIIVALPGTIMGFFGGGFTAGSHILVVLAFAQLVNAGTGSVGVFLQLTERDVLVAGVAISSLVMLFGSGVVLGAAYGSMGIVWAYAITLIVNSLVTTYLVVTSIRRVQQGKVQPLPAVGDAWDPEPGVQV